MRAQRDGDAGGELAEGVQSMICQIVSTPAGGAFVCTGGRRQRCECDRPANLLCDWIVPSNKSGTCDAPLCRDCTTSPRPEKDLCPAHAAEFERWKAEKKGNIQ